MRENAERISYRLPLSVVKITGVVTSGVRPEDSLDFAEATSDVKLAVEADPRPEWQRHISVEKSFGADKEFELELTADGRLTSSSGTSAGAGSAMIEAGIRIGTFVGAQLVAALASPAPTASLRVSEDRQRKGTSFEETLKSEQLDLHTRREAYRSAIVALQSKIAAYGTRVATDPTASGALLEGTVLRTTLDRVRTEAAAVEAEVDAWRRSRFPTSSKDYAFQLGTDELPKLTVAKETAPFTLGDLAPPLREAAERLGVVVARVDEPAEPAEVELPEESEDDGIRYRVPCRTSLAVYERPLGETTEFKLRSVTPAWVLDRKSQLGFLNFDSWLFSKNTSKLEFGDTGAPSKVTVDRESAARQLSTALAAAPGQIKESVDQASAVTEGIAKLRAGGAERRLADLERRKKLVDAEIAEKGALATRAQREELERLNLQIEVADAQSKLAPEPAAQPSPNKELEDRIERAKLELELRQAEFGTDLLSRLSSSQDGSPKSPEASPNQS